MPQRPSRQPKNSGVDATLARHGGLSYLEIPATDPLQSAAFYKRVLGWTLDTSDPKRVKFSDRTGHLIGRWSTRRQPAREPGLLPYIYVDDIRKTISAVIPSGGEVILPPYPEGDLLVAMIRDPGGNVIGLWQESRA